MRMLVAMFVSTKEILRHTSCDTFVKRKNSKNVFVDKAKIYGDSEVYNFE